MAGADAGSWRGGAAVGGAGETGPLSLLRLEAPRGTGCGGEEEGRAQLPSLQTPILHIPVRTWPFPRRSWPLHLLDCGGHAGIAQLHLQLQKALFPPWKPHVSEFLPDPAPNLVPQ